MTAFGNADGDPGQPGPDGRVHVAMTLQGYRFDVSWDARKDQFLRRRGIACGQAVRVLDDPGVQREFQDAPPYPGQYRATGRAPDGRMLTLALELLYPDDLDEDSADVGIIRVYAASHASAAVRARYDDDGR